MPRSAFRRRRFQTFRGSPGVFRLIGTIAAGLIVLSSSASAAELGTVTEWGRTVERLAIVLVGGMALFCGFSLFKITAERGGELLAKGGKWSLRLSQVGPGVFFALFGSFIVSYSLYQAPSIKSHGTEIRGIGPDAPGSERIRREGLTALNVITLYLGSGKPAPTTDQLKQLNTAAEKLDVFRASIIDAQVGKGRYAEWQGLRRDQRDDPVAFRKRLESDPDLRRRFLEIEDLMSPVQETKR